MGAAFMNGVLFFFLRVRCRDRAKRVRVFFFFLVNFLINYVHLPACGLWVLCVFLCAGSGMPAEQQLHVCLNFCVDTLGNQPMTVPSTDVSFLMREVAA